MPIQTWLRPLLDILYPPRCVACGRPGSFLCDTCRGEAQPVGSAWCIRCGNPLSKPGLCATCQADPPDPLDAIRGVFLHTGPIRQSIHALKYRGIRELAPILAAELVAYLQAHPLPADCIIPVPLHPQRERARGFNQSWLLAQEVGRALGIPARQDLLHRIRNTPSQTGLRREQRWTNVAGAFAVEPGISLHGKRILIVDDVATTGATLRACALALQEAGASTMWGLTVARAVK